jgi:hypothetical protein
MCEQVTTFTRGADEVDGCEPLDGLGGRSYRAKTGSTMHRTPLRRTRYGGNPERGDEIGTDARSSRDGFGLLAEHGCRPGCVGRPSGQALRRQRRFEGPEEIGTATQERLLGAFYALVRAASP